MATNRARRYVPAQFDPASPAAVREIYQDLERRLAGATSLEEWILDWEEARAVLQEHKVLAYIAMSRDTADAAAEARYMQFATAIMPVLEQGNFQLRQQLLAAPGLARLGPGYDLFLRAIRAEAELFRAENLPLLARERELIQEYNKIIGAQRAEHGGQLQSLEQLGPLLADPDRQVREAAWRASAAAQRTDAARLDALFDQLWALRQQIASQAGFANYRDYAFQTLKRFDYTPADCDALHSAIETHVVPALARDLERRRTQLGVDRLRPWDERVNPDQRPPLRPFASVAELRDGCQRIFSALDPELGSLFAELDAAQMLDLEHRPGKVPGGYSAVLPERRLPYIFMNAVGSQWDVDMLLHEIGHAFHYLLARNLPLSAYHQTEAEIAEVASMAMELLARPHLGEFYPAAELARIGDDQLRNALGNLPFRAMLDAFQHWVYTTPGQDAAARRAYWAALAERFQPGSDWSGLEEERATGWQFYTVFCMPFYAIEYAIAQLAALRIWLNAEADPAAALAAYKRGLALGSSQPLPAVFAATGAPFDWSDGAVASLISGTLARMSAES